MRAGNIGAARSHHQVGAEKTLRLSFPGAPLCGATRNLKVVYSPAAAGEIPRFARNDTRKHVFSTLLGMLPVLCGVVDDNVIIQPDIERIQGVPGPVAVELRQDYKLRLGAIQTGGARW